MEQNVAYGITGIKNEQNLYETVNQVERKKIDQPTQPAKKFQGLRKLKCSSVLSMLALILALLAVILAVVLFINRHSSTQSVTDSTMTKPSSTAPAACGGPGWRRVAFLNMTDPNQSCPQGLKNTSYSIRSCGRSHESRRNCSSVTVPVNGQQYSQVCGRVIAYRWGVNWGFFGYTYRHINLTGQYLDGISLTHGTERTHIWSFASGSYQGNGASDQPLIRCPCDPGNGYTAPPFVGNDYFCESAAVSESDRQVSTRYRLFTNNTLWDGDGCVSGNSCCQFNNPPWFKKTLPVPTTDDIELRLCLGRRRWWSDIAIQLLEMLVK